MRDPNCMCGETTVDPWCVVCCPETGPRLPQPGESVEDPECCVCHPDADTVSVYDAEKHCPTCHSDNMWAHGKPCYYCGQPVNNLAANPSEWNVYLCHEDDPGRIKPHHIGCVSERLDVAEKLRGLVKALLDRPNREAP